MYKVCFSFKIKNLRQKREYKLNLLYMFYIRLMVIESFNETNFIKELYKSLFQTIIFLKQNFLFDNIKQNSS